MIDASFLEELRQFSLVFTKRLTSKFTGERKSSLHGRGMVFHDHRIYAPGDDFRSIDWKIYARTDDLYIRTFEEERSLVVHTVIDSSASMDYGSPKKFDYASMLAVGFAYLAVKANEKFMYCTFSDDLQVFQPKRGMGHLAAMIELLNKVKLRGKSNFLKSMQKYRKTITTKSLVVIFSDFLFDLSEIREALYLFKNMDVKVVQVLDSTESELSLAGDFRLRDLETGDILRTEITPRLKKEYEEQLRLHSARIRKACDELSFAFLQVTTSMPVFDVFSKLL